MHILNKAPETPRAQGVTSKIAASLRSFGIAAGLTLALLNPADSKEPKVEELNGVSPKPTQAKEPKADDLNDVATQPDPNSIQAFALLGSGSTNNIPSGLNVPPFVITVGKLTFKQLLPNVEVALGHVYVGDIKDPRQTVNHGFNIMFKYYTELVDLKAGYDDFSETLHFYLSKSAWTLSVAEALPQQFHPEGYTNAALLFQQPLAGNLVVKLKAKVVFLDEKSLYIGEAYLTGGVPFKEIAHLGGKIGVITGGTNLFTRKTEVFKPVFAINISRGF